MPLGKISFVRIVLCGFGPDELSVDEIRGPGEKGTYTMDAETGGQGAGKVQRVRCG
jgi:hypothetical protein